MNRKIVLIVRDEFIEAFKQKGFEVLWLLPELYTLLYEGKRRVLLQEKECKERLRCLTNEILKFNPAYFLFDQCFFFMLLNRLENMSGSVMSKLWIDFVQDLNKKGINTIIRFQDEPRALNTKEMLHFTKSFRAIVTYTMQAQKFYEKSGQKVIYMPDFVSMDFYEGCNRDELFAPDSENDFKADFDLFFAGAMTFKRKLFFNLLSKKLNGLDFFFGSKEFYYTSRKSIDFDVTNRQHIKKIYKNTAINVIYSIFYDSLFNKSWGVGDRAFNIGYCHGFFLHDYRRHLADLFDVDPDMYVFKNLNDCHKKIKFYLENKDLRRQLSESFHATVIERHTAEARVSQLIPEIERMVNYDNRT